MFPIATPLIAGPGAMGAAILLMADAERPHPPTDRAGVTPGHSAFYLHRHAAGPMQQLLGIIGMHVITGSWGCCCPL